MPAVGPLLAPIEAAIHDKLIPVLLGGMPDRPSQDASRRLVSNCMRFGKMATRNLVKVAPRAHICLVQAGIVLKAILLVGGELNTAEQHEQVQGAKEASKNACKHEKELFHQQLAHHASTWAASPSQVSGSPSPKAAGTAHCCPATSGAITSASATALNPSALSCKVGGLVIIRHNDVQQG